MFYVICYKDSFLEFFDFNVYFKIELNKYFGWKIVLKFIWVENYF